MTKHVHTYCRLRLTILYNMPLDLTELGSDSPLLKVLCILFASFEFASCGGLGEIV